MVSAGTSKNILRGVSRDSRCVTLNFGSQRVNRMQFSQIMITYIISEEERTVNKQNTEEKYLSGWGFHLRPFQSSSTYHPAPSSSDKSRAKSQATIFTVQKMFQPAVVRLDARTVEILAIEDPSRIHQASWPASSMEEHSHLP